MSLKEQGEDLFQAMLDILSVDALHKFRARIKQTHDHQMELIDIAIKKKEKERDDNVRENKPV